MEHPHDPYHVRPFPQQPKRGGKELLAALGELEAALKETLPDPAKIRDIQRRIHEAAKDYNDDKLINRLRHLSDEMASYEKSPTRITLEAIIKDLLKLRVELKHL